MSEKRKKLTSRETLRNYFNTGCLPKAKHFHDLIDSTLNMEDEGFNKTPEDGLQVFTRGGESSLLSFFREGVDLGVPPWRVRFDTGRDSLQFAHTSGDDEGSEPGSEPAAGDEARADPLAVLSLAPGGRVGVNVTQPECELDVGGVVKARGRMGIMPDRVPDGGEKPEPGHPAPPLLADGKWHNITGELTGCQALEVLAGVGGRVGEGQYSLVRATALNAYSPPGWYFSPFGFNFLNHKNKISVQQAYYRSRRDKLELRWFAPKTGQDPDPQHRHYFLQVRSRRDYGEDEHGNAIRILYHVTELWQHSTMRDLTSAPPPEEVWWPSEARPEIPPGEGGPAAVEGGPTAVKGGSTGGTMSTILKGDKALRQAKRLVKRPPTTVRGVMKTAAWWSRFGRK